MQLQQIILHLSLIQDLTPRFLHELLGKIAIEDLSKVYQYTVQDFIHIGCSQDQAQLLVQGLQNQQRLLDELKLVEQHNASFLTILCEQYPILLKHIDVPPLVLYYQGDVSLFAHEKTFACVGARKAHVYVRDALLQLIVPMVQNDWVIVSGGALGADTYAHQITMDHKGKTIVVVGSGLCHQYPPQNKSLFEQVVYSGGLIVSSFHMQMPPEPYCFPMRNRIISGLSRGCLVLQAAQKSGALITAQCALQQGREVFALPGSIFDPLSAGCHELIQQGAKLVTSTQDIVDELSYLGKADQVQMLIHADDNGSKDKDQKKPKRVQPAIIACDVASVVDDVERAVLHYTVVPVTAETLLTNVGISLDVLQSKLFELSLDGKISQDGMGLWKRV